MSTKIELIDYMHVSCSKCVHKQGCKAPCAPVSSLINKDVNAEHEIYGENEIVLIKNTNRRERLFCDLQDYEILQAEFENKNLFAQENATVQTQIFIDRFFNQMSYREIAEKHGISEHYASSSYGKAYDRVVELLQLMNKRKRGLELVQTRTRKELTAAERAYILTHFFNFSFSDVAEIEGIKRTKLVASVKDIENTIQAKLNPVAA